MERTQFWKGIAIGVAATVGVLVLLMLLSMTVMGRSGGMMCPMCGRGMDGAMRGRSPDGMMGDGMMGQMPDWMMSRGMGPEMMEDMRPIHDLLIQHEKIQRKVEEIPGGVRTVTTSKDPKVAEAIRTHVRQMKERLEEDQPIRMMDPLFREIFRHYEKIRLQIENVPGGVRATETSADPEVVLLIRQHAKRAVSEFVSGGMQRAMQPTPLPEGYQRKGRE